jgi:hypothetical protein
MVETTPSQPSDPAACAASAEHGLWARVKDWCRHAFQIEAYDETSLSEDERALLNRLARWVHDRQLTAAAILWVDSNRHFNFITSQALIFAQPAYDLSHPLIKFLLKRHNFDFPPEELTQLAVALEKRFSIEYFVRRLEALASGEYNNGPGSASAASEPEAGATAGPPPQT